MSNPAEQPKNPGISYLLDNQIIDFNQIKYFTPAVIRFLAKPEMLDKENLHHPGLLSFL